MDGKIVEIAVVRNRLASNNFDSQDNKIMNQITQEISGMDTPFKVMALNSLRNCMHDIKNSNFELAAQELQLIHNFPFKNPSNWNSKYFYTVELLSYMDQVNNVERISKLIQLVADLQQQIDKIKKDSV